MIWANPAVLWALGLVSVPVIIHLLNRRRFRVVNWAAMEFLLLADKKNRRRVRMEHLIVLLLRCLAVALIVLLVARPAATSGAFAMVPGARSTIERVVILDDSASMSQKTRDRRAFDIALDAMTTLLRQLGERYASDPVTVFRTSRHSPDLARASAKSQAVSDLVQRAAMWKEPTDTRFRVAATLKEALVRDAGHENDVRAVYVLTDLRRSDWAAGDGHLARDIVEQLRANAKETTFFVIDCASDDEQNVGITSLVPQERLVTAGIHQKLVATVRNFGTKPVADTPIRLQVVGGDSLPVPPVPEIAPGAERKIEIGYTFADAGAFALRVELEHDRFERDDARAVALEVVKAVRVLIVDGKPSDEAFEGSADFVWRALAPPGEVRSGVEPVVVASERLGDEDLSANHAVVTCDLERWPQTRLAALERFVREGGGVAFFLGESVDSAAYERDLWKDGKGLLPSKLGDLLGGGRDEPVRLSATSLDHALLRVFQGDDNPFLRKIRARRRYACPIDPKKDARTSVVLRFDDPERTPAILEKSFGEGRVVVVNTTANRAWTEWPRDPSFPVTCQELVRYLAPQATAGRVVAVGEPIVRGLNPAVFEPRARLEVPGEQSARELSAAPREGSDALWIRFEDTLRAGVYRLQLFPRQGEPRFEPYAVVLDPRESELAKANEADLARGLEGVNIRFARAADRSLLALSEGDQQELWRSCAIALLVILTLESILAWHAAHHGDAAPRSDVMTGARA